MPWNADKGPSKVFVHARPHLQQNVSSMFIRVCIMCVLVCVHHVCVLVCVHHVCVSVCASCVC